jgi:hypothetical protein
MSLMEVALIVVAVSSVVRAGVMVWNAVDQARSSRMAGAHTERMVVAHEASVASGKRQSEEHAAHAEWHRRLDGQIAEHNAMHDPRRLPKAS